MLAKLTRAFGVLLKDVEALESQVERMDKVRPIVTEGKPGKNGVSPKIEDIVLAVLAQIPTPKDGESPDPKSIIADVLALMPKPRDGRDADPANVSDIAAIVFAKIPKPKDGHNGPDLETVVMRVKAQVQDGKPGIPGKQGKPGKNGVSVTKVKLDNNELFVFLDGKKNSVGKIKIPAATAPFRPGSIGGGGGGTGLREFKVIQVTADITVNGRQILICKNTALIEVTLGPNAKIGDRLHIKRRGGEIRIIGTVDGVVNPLISELLADSVHLVFDGIDWSQI